MGYLIEAKELSKKFGDKLVVDKLSFGIEQGDIYGFLGQNGAGKSTTMRMLLGLIYPTSGTVLINDKRLSVNTRKPLKEIGAIIERPDLYGYLSGWDNLRFFAKISGVKVSKDRLYEVLELVGLLGREGDKVKAYSQGMKQRLGIAISLVHEPDLLILDEPTNGLDPQGIAEMRELILTLNKEYGKTILISSHLLYEIEQVATKMLIINEGKKIVEGRVDELLNPNEKLIEVSVLPDDMLMEKVRNTSWKEYLVESNSAHYIFKMHPRKVPALNKMMVQEGAHILEIKSRHSLEAYFLSLTTAANAETGVI